MKLDETTIVFLGEQDGPPERELKARLVRRFEAGRQVDRAYLARVDYGDGGFHVAVCVRTGAGCEHAAVLEDVRAAFQGILRYGAHLDMLFLSDTLELGVRRVCRPFYVRASAPGPASVH